ncbi:MAG: ROK family protein [Candidatus Omnitrophica bacterium]|nr:ROK family protein [Candidatus Omnitrophota bacterium]
MKILAGIDIGGTKISVLLVDPKGTILSRKQIPTRTGKSSRAAIRELTDALRVLLQARKRDRLLGIGVGLPGPVNPAQGLVPWSPNLRGWEGIPLKRILEKKFRVPVRMDNDANAAGYGEKIFGAGKNARDFVYMTVSTGIGGGLVLGGRVHRGASFCGGEVGHMTIVPGGHLCNCGKNGCLEAYASGTAIAREARRRIKSGARSLIGTLSPRLSDISAITVTQAAAAGDRVASEIFRDAGVYLGIGIATLMNVLNPSMIVLGGSVIKAARFFWRPMMQSARKEAWPVAFKACRVLKTALGENAGNLGAAALVLEEEI